MRFSARTWAILSALLFVAAILLWRKGNEIEARKRLNAPAVAKTNAPSKQGATFDPFSTKTGLQLASLTLDPLKAEAIKGGKADAAEIKKRFPYRLQNTDKALNELVKDEGAVLLANALIDTRGALPEIPEHLRAEGDPGSYIVQWKDAPDAEFRARLKEAGASIISYVPNNAYYVKVDKAGADRLQADAGVRAVMAFEPYYKLDQVLLGFAVEQKALPPEATLRITVLPGTGAGIENEIVAVGGEIVGQEPSPFGPQYIVRPGANALVELAQLAEVQGIERAAPRQAASDLTRITLGIATGTDLTNENYLGLTGEGALVNINDTGIQPDHPTLVDTTIHLPGQPLLSLMLTNNDPDGHGTFVASLIAGNGANSPSAFETNTIPGSGTNTNTTEVVINVLPGSSGNPDLRGIAPDVDLLALPLDPTGPGYADVTRPLLDTWLIQSAAQTNYLVLDRTNALISNNSWTYGVPSYDSSAARYDQAVRDALPGTPNEQPLLFVFAAGNSGFGDNDGTGGSVDTVESPGTAKNVITVGALESLRLITNVSFSVTNFIYLTNEDGTILTNEQVETFFPFAEMTDSATEVASFSSRGNVGIGIEGDFGRFKPDVVAPGTMLVAARSAGWNFAGIDTNDSQFGELFAELHEHLEEYRFDSGSTFAAANISGMLALIEEYYRTQAPGEARGRLSPALLKALLINGTRSLGGNYDLAVETAANFQGWGLPTLPNTLSSYTTNDHGSVAPAKARLRYVEQSATNAVVTGESRTWNVTLSTNGSLFPLRVTLVWTDPPGNPAVAVKLVNDLDLVVTNLETGTVFYGNRLVFGGDFSEPITPVEGAEEPVDSINNVENVMIRTPDEFGREFSVTVRGQRVNVNAVSDYLSETGDTNDVAQDFALVISSEMGSDPSMNDPDPNNPEGYLPNLDVFDVFERVDQPNIEPRRGLTTITNGLPLLEERVGANPSMIGTNGTVGQWNFYVFTNITVSNALVTARAGSNVAFVTFNPPNLSRPRSVEADIDLYVSTHAGLTNLEPVHVANALKSRERGGIESVILTNATIGQVFYIGVKSEDQQAAEYSFIGVSSDQPFEQDRNGQSILIGVPLTAAVLDGTARRPSAGTMLAIGLSNRRVANVTITNQVFHENLPDLVGVMSHGQTRVVLNNHTFGTNGLPYGTNVFIYNDNPMFNVPNSRPTDGPGSLNFFAGQKVIGPWFLEMIDNSPSHTGQVQLLTVVIDPLRDPLLFGNTITDTVSPFQINYYPIDVPPNATNLTFRFANMTPGGRLEFYIRRDQLPTTNIYEFTTNVVAPGAVFSFPVIGGGTYFVGLRNPTGVGVTFDLTVDALFANDSDIFFDHRGEIADVPDNTTTNAIIDFNLDKIVADVQVGVRMKHPRTADIELALISPQGTRVLLAENRGQTNNVGFGSLTILTNGFTNGSPIISTQVSYVIFTEDTNNASFPVKFANPGSTITLGSLGTAFANGFEGSVLAGNYREGTSLAGGWEVVNSPADTNTPSQISIINGLGLAHTGNTLLSLGTAGIERQVEVTVGRPYKLRFAARAGRVLDLYSTGVNDSYVTLPAQTPDPHYMLLQASQTEFPGPVAYVFGNDQPVIQSGLWMSNNLASQWIAPYPTTPALDGVGQFVFRTYINLYEQDPRTALIPSFYWSANDVGDFVRLNGRVLNYPADSSTNLSTLRQLGGIVTGLNVLDFFVTDTNGVEGLRVQVNNGLGMFKNTTPQLTASIGGKSELKTVDQTWRFYEVEFTPTNANTVVELLTQRGEVWIDSVSVETSGDIFLHPEESFEILDGERAMGEWRIEARDTRTGAILPTEEVLEWNMELAAVDPVNRATRAEASFTSSFTLHTNQVHYLVLDPCRSATFARFTLTGLGNFDGLEMRADWSGFPTGIPELEDFLPMRNNENPGEANGRLVFQVDRSLPAPARLTGKPLYIVIYNRFQVATNSYQLLFESDGDCTPLTPPPIITPDGPPTPGTVPPDTGGGDTNDVSGLFQFTVPPDVRSATVTVVSDGDVSVYGLKDEPPTPLLFSNFVDNNNSSGVETLVIGPTTGPTVDQGVWYVRIVNESAVQVNFTVQVTFQMITPPGQIQLFIFLNSLGGVQLQWNSEPGVTYELLGSDNIVAPATAWTLVTTVTANNTLTAHSIDPAAPRFRFYIVRQVP